MLSVQSIEADCYPLSKPMIFRLADDRRIPLVLSSERTSKFNWQELTPLLQDIDELREATSKILAPALVHPTLLTTDWFKKTLQEHTPPLLARKGSIQTEHEPFTEKTLSLWRSRGILRSDDRDLLNFHTASAVLMMRLADRKRIRGFLPPGNHDQEPFMYVWRLDSPKHSPVPCGLPLSDDIPNHSFLFTRWQALGKLKQGGWLPFANLGSVRWKGVREEQGTLLWDLSEQDIAMWDPTLVALGEGILDGVAPLTRHTLATMILLKQASLALTLHAVPMIPFDSVEIKTWR